MVRKQRNRRKLVARKVKGFLPLFGLEQGAPGNNTYDLYVSCIVIIYAVK